MPVATTGERNRTRVGRTRPAIASRRMPEIAEDSSTPKSSEVLVTSMNPKA